jgi:hypothetical protein
MRGAMVGLGMALVLAALGAPAGAAPVLVETVVAEVGGTPITAGDVALARALGLFDLPPAAGAITAEHVERYIRARLVVDEAARLDLAVEDAEVDAAWQRLAGARGGPVAFEAWLAGHAVEPAWARRLLREHLVQERFVELRFGAFVFVLEEDVTAALGPGQHTPEARARARERLRAEIAGRRLAEWLQETAQRVEVRRRLPPGGLVALPGLTTAP